MPDIRGWSLSDVNVLSKLTNINLTYSGYGYVESQSLEAGRLINKGSLLNVSLNNKRIEQIDDGAEEKD